MADWEAELATLLRELDVSLERDGFSEQRRGSNGMRPTTETPDGQPSGARRAPVQGDASGATAARAPSAEDDEVSAVRSEIEATLARVMYMTRAGQLEPALRDDVVFVLKALTRPRPAALRPKERHEWQLDSAAAVLHFCRVVLRLTHALAPETQLE